MKILKWFPIVLLILLGVLFLITLFLPSEITIQAEKQINVPRETLFQNIATYEDRAKWDPWLTTEPEAEVVILSNKKYVGSTYSWTGEKIGSGTIEVISVQKPERIDAHIWFGETPDPGLVKWLLESNNEGTFVTWSFTSKSTNPYGKFVLQLMKSPLSNSFNEGLENLKIYMESPSS